MRRYICVVGIALAALGSSYAQTLVFIGNGISGDGRLTIPVDPFGAWYANFNTGANNGRILRPPWRSRSRLPNLLRGHLPVCWYQLPRLPSTRSLCGTNSG
jgi:hypothetical protein